MIKRASLQKLLTCPVIFFLSHVQTRTYAHACWLSLHHNTISYNLDME